MGHGVSAGGARLAAAPAVTGTALCREFFGQGWMKLEKNERTPYIMKNTKHFNDVSGAAGWGGERKKERSVRRAGADRSAAQSAADAGAAASRRSAT